MIVIFNSRSNRFLSLYNISPESGKYGYVGIYFVWEGKYDYFYYDEKGAFVGVYKGTNTKKKWPVFE